MKKRRLYHYQKHSYSHAN